MQKPNRQCQALNMNGKRCPRKATKYLSGIHLNSEIYGSSWITAVAVCERCQIAVTEKRETPDFE
jgi:hypothetical protein